MRIVFRAFGVISILALMSLTLQAKPQVSTDSAVQETGREWHKVENKRVCMVNDMEFPRDQIPVQVGNKTYYGCCESCKENLGKNEALRFATDPVSRKRVDKATAFIAAGPDGAVQYFENEANFKTFIAVRKKP